MNTYKLQLGYPNIIRSVTIIGQNISIPLSADNTDYQRFKKEVLDGVELQNVEGNTMTTEEVTEFIATLP
jgi:hypothetical protein